MWEQKRRGVGFIQLHFWLGERLGEKHKRLRIVKLENNSGESSWGREWLRRKVISLSYVGKDALDILMRVKDKYGEMGYERAGGTIIRANLRSSVTSQVPVEERGRVKTACSHGCKSHTEQGWYWMETKPYSLLYWWQGSSRLHRQEKWCFESGPGSRMNASSVMALGTWENESLH